MSDNFKKPFAVRPPAEPLAVRSGHGRTLAPPSALRQIRRDLGGLVAFLVSWWRY